MSDDVIKLGINNLQETRYQTGDLKEIKLMFKFKLDSVDLSNDDILEYINKLSNIQNLEEGVEILKVLYQQEKILSFNFKDCIKSFTRKLFEKMPLKANKVRRNNNANLKDRILNALIPDLTIEYTRRETEILVLELAKDDEIADPKKKISDELKIMGHLHDMLRHIFIKLPDENKHMISSINVYGLVVSKMSLKIYQMHIPYRQIYIFQLISTLELPLTFYDFKCLEHATINLIQLRKLLDENFNEITKAYKEKLKRSRTPSPLTSRSEDWLVEMETSPTKYLKLYKEEQRKKKAKKKET
ncbi:564_t:CDS:2, partial [Entrophospora sp. SA101]